MNQQSLDKLIREHASAKKKMILGIVFSAIATFFCYLGIILAAIETGFVVLVILSLPFFGVGTPFFIIGLVKTIKTNKKIAQAKQEEGRIAAAPAQEEPVQAQVEPVQAQVEPVQAQVEPVQVREEPVQTRVEPVQIQEEPVQVQVEPVQRQEGAPALDWEKYAPLDAGVSYKADKDYKFHRADGFVGSVPQKFVDRTFPRCPICCSNEPNWTIAQHNQMSWKGNLYLFKCSHCESIISMSMPDVTTLGNGASGIISNPNVGLTNLMVKASSGKEAGAVYAVVESVGTSGVSRACEGKEFKLEHLQEMFLRQ